MSAAKVVDSRAIAAVCAGERVEGRSLVHCHGCFDGLHIGHVRHLRAAAALGDVLVVSVTADNYVDKGPGRPVFSHDLRMEFLAELSCVDWVTISRSPTAEQVIAAVRPNSYVKGGEYEVGTDGSNPNLDIEIAMVRRHGGEVVFTQEELVLSSRALLKPRSAAAPLTDGGSRERRP